jgi:hypothetical protein
MSPATESLTLQYLPIDGGHAKPRMLGQGPGV